MARERIHLIGAQTAQNCAQLRQNGRKKLSYDLETNKNCFIDASKMVDEYQRPGVCVHGNVHPFGLSHDGFIGTQLVC